MSDAENYSGQRRRLLRHLVHTLGCNEVFVAFATVARAVRARGGDDALEEWRSAAACERLGCHPDGCYRRGASAYGFFLDYDRGTERGREYTRKLDGYYRYRASEFVDAVRDYWLPGGPPRGVYGVGRGTPFITRVRIGNYVKHDVIGGLPAWSARQRAARDVRG